MLRFKRLYTFILQTFLPLFIMTFGICWFIVLMQFLWRYIDDMVGKGLDVTVLGEMFVYAAITLVPMALPLSILFSSLMIFGNLGESLELLAMKSAGISLIRIMRPLIILICSISIGAFYFQDIVMPISQVKLWSLLASMKMKSPELEIPEGVFFNEIQGYNLYVKEKDKKNGMLKHVMIYNYSSGFNNAMVIVADSGKLKVSDDKLFLVLTLYNGEAFQNQNRQSSSAQVKEAIPYRRENFLEKEILIEFDANFNRMDESFYQNQYIGKTLDNLQLFVDSVSVRLDSIRAQNAGVVYNTSYKRIFPNTIKETKVLPPAADKLNPAANKSSEEKVITMNFDSLYQANDASKKAGMLSRAKSSFESLKSDFFFKGIAIGDEAQKMRRHKMEWHTRFAVSFACLMFFFVGAPLGAIIRKGGFGLPVVLSVLIFIVYYCVNNIGSKMARDGVWEVWQGMWFSSVVFTALGAFITYKAAKDSALLNADTYINVLKNLIGKREMRKLLWKEVIIFNPDYSKIDLRLSALVDETQQYTKHHKRWLNYISYWKKGGKDTSAEHISTEVEEIVEELSNSDHILILNKLLDYPVIGGYNQLGENPDKRLSMGIGLFLPLGILLYFLVTYKRKLLRQDILIVKKVSEELREIIVKLNDSENL